MLWKQKFTRKERDAESGLDYFLARYYSSAQGRFTSPDEFAGGPVESFAATASDNPTFYADLFAPQTLNKYEYCLNNPLEYVDPNGHQEKKTLRQQLANSMNAIAEYFGVSNKPFKTDDEANPNKIAAAGGRTQRIEKAHKGEGHAYAHINYYLGGDPKKTATIRVQSVGKEFHRTPKKKIP